VIVITCPTTKPVDVVTVKVAVAGPVLVTILVIVVVGAAVMDVITSPTWNGPPEVSVRVVTIGGPAATVKVPVTPVTAVDEIVPDGKSAVCVRLMPYGPAVHGAEPAKPPVQLRIFTVPILPAKARTWPIWKGPPVVVVRTEAVAVTATEATKPNMVPVMVPTTGPAACKVVMRQEVVQEVGDTTLIVSPEVGRPEVPAVRA